MLNDSEAGRKVDRSCCLSNTAFLIGNRNYFTHSAKELSKLKQYCNITLSSYLIKNNYSHPDVENSIRTASENQNITSFRRSYGVRFEPVRCSLWPPSIRSFQCSTGVSFFRLWFCIEASFLAFREKSRSGKWI